MVIRVLHVVSALGSGGVESMLSNYYKLMDKNEIRFDFIIHDSKVGILEQFFEQNGSHIYRVTSKKQNILKNILQTYKIIKNGNYDVIHCHQNFSSCVPLVIGWICKCKIRIAHSHAKADSVINNERLLNKIMRLIILKFANVFCACSDEAGKFLFGEKVDIKIIYNVIDVEKFRYDSYKREDLRKKYGIEDKFVVGNIGRLCIHKNQKFLVEIVSELKKKIEKVHLVIVGNGELKDEILSKVKKLELSSNFLLMDECNNINEILNMFDAFVLPSLSEGLGMVLIEAQANSLKCIASNKVIPKEVKITNLLEFEDLDNGTSGWVKRLMEIKEQKRIGKNYEIKSEYDARIGSIKLLELYSQLIKEKCIYD